MYKIYHLGKRYGNKLFTNYEAARSYARKLIRMGKFVPTASPWQTDYSDRLYSNPSLTHYSVTIKA